MTAAQTALKTYQQDAQADGGPATSNVQISTDLSTLASAVQSGNMADAKTSFAAYRTDVHAAYAETQSTASGDFSPFDTDLKSLVSAIQGGDATAAQTSAAALAKDLQGLATKAGSVGHHHHHHGGGEVTASTSPGAPAGGPPVDNDADDTPSAAVGTATAASAHSQSATSTSDLAAFILKEFTSALSTSKPATAA